MANKLQKPFSKYCTRILPTFEIFRCVEYSTPGYSVKVLEMGGFKASQMFTILKSN